MLTGLNHITITVADLQRSLHFYRDRLGFKAHVKWRSGAYLSLGDLWFCLAAGRPGAHTDYSHIAFTADAAAIAALRARLRAQGVREWQDNSSEGDSIYILDPDDHKLEIHNGSLQSRLANLQQAPYAELEWL